MMADISLRALVTRRTFIKGVGMLGASAILAGHATTAFAEQQADEHTPTPLLAIIHTNDTHGHDLAIDGIGDERGNFSMAAVAALKREWERKGYEVLLVDAGDATQGMPLVDISQGASAIAFMNACSYQLMTVGNHEFDWGPNALAANELAASFPFLSANVIDKQLGTLRFAPSKVFELSDGTKVGFFGLTTPETMATAGPNATKYFDFLGGEDLFACARDQVRELREQGCDIVVCVGHLGNELPNNSGSKDVLEHVDGIDLFIDGHDHLEVQEEVAGTPLVETGCYLHNIGVVAIDEGGFVPELIAAGSFGGIENAAQAFIEDEWSRVEARLNVVLGSTPFYLNGERNPGLRTGETNLGDFCADALRWTASTELQTEIDAAILSAGGIRASVEAGDISLATIKTVMPYSNRVVVVNLTGAQLLEAIEAACQAIGKEKPIAAFPQVSGITFALDASIPYKEGPLYPHSTYPSPAAPGARVTIYDVAGRGFDEAAVYSIATIEFLCQGGDTYHAFKDAADAEQPVSLVFDYEAIASYLVEGCDHEVPAEYAEPQGRITITGLP